MSEVVKDVEFLLEKDGVAALVLREHLMPVEGEDGVIFPPTFAAAEDTKIFAGGYNIDSLGGDKNICLIDSVGSQANRIEPMFAEEPYSKLVPQIVVEAGAREVNLLEAGHRAGDAIVRCSELQAELQAAFKDLQRGDAQRLAMLAPTSLVFGVWDSRDTQAKSPRLLAATIRAYDVRKLTRSAQYNPAVDYVAEGVLEDTDEKKALDLYSKRGFRHVPASATHGGVIATSGIRREVTLHIAALRLLRASTPEATADLRRYLLGLALTAFTRPAVGYLRQGCNLVLHETKRPEATIVFSDGRRVASGITHETALAFAAAAARKLEPIKNRRVKFDKDLAKKDLAESDKPKKAKEKKK